MRALAATLLFQCAALFVWAANPVDFHTGGISPDAGAFVSAGRGEGQQTHPFGLITDGDEAGQQQHQHQQKSNRAHSLLYRFFRQYNTVMKILKKQELYFDYQVAEKVAKVRETAAGLSQIQPITSTAQIGMIRNQFLLTAKALDETLVYAAEVQQQILGNILRTITMLNDYRTKYLDAVSQGLFADDESLQAAGQKSWQFSDNRLIELTSYSKTKAGLVKVINRAAQVQMKYYSFIHSQPLSYLMFFLFKINNLAQGALSDGPRQASQGQGCIYTSALEQGASLVAQKIPEFLGFYQGQIFDPICGALQNLTDFPKALSALKALLAPANLGMQGAYLRATREKVNSVNQQLEKISRESATSSASSSVASTLTVASGDTDRKEQRSKRKRKRSH